MTKVQIELSDAIARDGTLDIRGARTAARGGDQAPASGLLAIAERVAEAGIEPIRINDQWRVIFRWYDGGAAEVQIVDYL